LERLFFAIPSEMAARFQDFPIQKIPVEWNFYKKPDFLHVQGMPEAHRLLEWLPMRGLAVVGTRRPQGRAEAFVRRIILQLRKSNLVILSGLAIGVDTCAHEAALEAGLPTIAVLGCGLNRQYPPENEELRLRILENGGLILSEYEPDEIPQPHYFLMRNRLIAGLSQATWIAQAPARSGALNTAQWARSDHRDCYATPAFPDDPSLLGNQKLIDDHHAQPIWGAHSLGATWMELSSIRPNERSSEKSAERDRTDPAHREEPLLEWIRCRTAQAGGVNMADLLDWAIQQGFSPLDFFERLQKSQQCGLVSEKNGVVVSN
jgi:DNA protecting protein DprA